MNIYSNSTFFLGTILTVAFLFRLFIIIHSNLTFYSDDAIYASIARFWINGDFSHVLHPTWPPLYPFVSAIIYFFIGNWEVSLRLVSTIASILMVISIYFLANKLLTRTSSLFLCLIVSFSPALVNISLMPLSDSLSVFFIIVSATLMFIGLYTKMYKFFFYASVFLALGTLSRSEGSLFFTLSMIYLAFYLFVEIINRRKFFVLKYIFKNLIVFLSIVTIFLITVSPYLIFIKSNIGNWTLSHKFSAQIQQGHTFALNSRNTTWAQEIGSTKNPNFKSPYFNGGVDYLLEHFTFYKNWFYQKLNKWVEIYLRNFSQWSILLIMFSLLALFDKKLFWGIGYIFFILSTAIPITIFSTPLAEDRYLVWTLPLILMLNFLGAERFLKIFNLNITKLSTVIIFILVLSISKFSLNQVNISNIIEDFTKQHYRQEIIAASTWIKINNPNYNPRIMMRHEGIEFYTDGETIYTPQIPYHNLIEYAIENKVDYIVAWSEELSNDSNLNNLMDTNIDHPGLKKVYQFPSTIPKVIIYSL